MHSPVYHSLYRTSHRATPQEQLWTDLQMPRGAKTARTKPHTLLSPVPRPFLQHTKNKLKSLLKRSIRAPRPAQSLKFKDLTKGFRLFRELFELEPDIHEPIISPTPEPLLRIPSIRVEKPKPKPIPKLQITEADSSSTSTLLDLDIGLQTPRHRASLHSDHHPTLQVTADTRPATLTPSSQPIITPVLRIQEIDASELASISSEESDHRFTSRRSSNAMYRRRETTLIKSGYEEFKGRRLTLAVGAQPSLMRDYSQQTAEMLGDTHFRLKGYKTQRGIPLRYFKNL